METKKTSRSTFSIIYYLNKSRANDNGELPVYVRVTANGTKSTLSIKRSIHPKNWSEKGNPVGNSNEIKELKNYMTEISAKLIKCHKVLEEEHQIVTADMVREAFVSGATKKRTETLFFAIADEFIKKQTELIGIDVSQLTVNRYKLTRSTFEEFVIIQGFGSNDFYVRTLSKGLIKDFEHYLKTIKKSGHNNAMKYLQRLKKIISYCLDRKLLDEDPFTGIKVNMKPTDRGYLTEVELQKLIEKDFGIERLNVVRDMFIFSCFTGLAYIDSKNLTRSELEQSPDGTMWIRTHRQKTNSRSNIPLLPIALDIIDKYADLEKLSPNERILPLSSNEKMNAYLKEIAIICQIDKNLTTHLARHTFATTVTLTNGVPIESVSKMLGHKSIKTTQIYGRIVDSKVGADMAELSLKFQQKPFQLQKVGS